MSKLPSGEKIFIGRSVNGLDWNTDDYWYYFINNIFLQTSFLSFNSPLHHCVPPMAGEGWSGILLRSFLLILIKSPYWFTIR